MCPRLCCGVQAAADAAAEKKRILEGKKGAKRSREISAHSHLLHSALLQAEIRGNDLRTAAERELSSKPQPFVPKATVSFETIAVRWLFAVTSSLAVCVPVQVATPMVPCLRC
jgi:hypothetical protein